MRLPYVLSCLELLQHHLSYQQGQGRTSHGVCMSYFFRCGHWWCLMCPGADKWGLGKSSGSIVATRLPRVLSCLELLQHHLSYQQGQGRTSHGVCMSYFFRCGHWWCLMCPGADKWGLGKSSGSIVATRLPRVLSCLELLQHHLSYQQGQGRTSHGVCMSYFFRCGHWWCLMCPGADKWRLGKLSGNIIATRLPYVLSCLELLQHHLSYPQGQGRTSHGVCVCMSYFFR